jgi:hypothetical protein
MGPIRISAPAPAQASTVTAVARRSEQSLAHSAISAFSKIKIPIYSQASCTFTARNRDYLLVYAYKVHAHEVYAREIYSYEVHTCEMRVYEQGS